MKKKKQSREELLKKKREAERRRYEKIKNDPVRWEVQKEKEQKKYAKKKKDGRRKLKKDMSVRELTQKRRYWRQKAKESREKKRANRKLQTFIRENSPPDSIVNSEIEDNISLDQPNPPFIVKINGLVPKKSASSEQENGGAETTPTCSKNLRNRYRPTPESTPRSNPILSSGSTLSYSSDAENRNKQSGRRQIRRDRSKLYRENLRLKAQINILERKLNKTRVDKHRKKKRQTQNVQTPSPGTKVRNLLSTTVTEVPKNVIRKISFAETITSQLKNNLRSLKTEKEKQLFASSVYGDGKILRKYKHLSTCKQFLTQKRITKAKNSTKMLTHLPKTFQRISPLLKSDVINFFEDDSVSRQSPGKKDCITRFKEKKQIRLLTDTLIRLHKKFLSTTSHKKLSYSLFCRLRPYWVRLPNVLQRETCYCVTHANVEHLIFALQTNNVVSYKSSDDMLEDICCNRSNEDCLSKECSTCKYFQIRYKEFNYDQDIEYSEWITKKVAYIEKSSKVEKFTQKTVKEKKNIALGDAVRKLEGLKSKFLNHVLTIEHQYKAIRMLKATLTTNEVLIHCDFSENYSCKYAHEVQSMHFGGSRQNITIHTVVIYFRDELETKKKCFATLSESLDHTTPAVWAHLEPLLLWIRQNLPQVNTLHFLSDSTCSQYRNKRMIYFLQYHLKDIFPGLNAFTWNYTESGHGKGAPDGVGGVLKRTADRLVAEGKDLNDFQSVFKYLEDRCLGITLLLVSEEQITKMKLLFENQTLKSFKGTLKVHQIAGKLLPGTIFLRSKSCFTCPIDESCRHDYLGNIL